MNTENDSRLELLKEWLIAVLPYHQFELTPASSDASFRRYFRVKQENESWIVMDAPTEYEDVGQFVMVDELLAKHGVNVPRIFAHNVKDGFLLLSDFGDTSYLSILQADNANELYQRAIDEIITMQCIAVADIDLPLYDETKLQAEMNLFPEWFLERHLGIAPPDWWPEIVQNLTREAMNQPQRLVHRDFHSRNLMLPEAAEIGVIDFQDAVIGPVSYDLVSLLKDCYIQWPQAQREQWINYYLDKALSAGILPDNQQSAFIRQFDFMGLQRHLKILGIFCRLNYRDNKPAYLADLSLTLQYVLQVTKMYPEFKKLHTFLTQSPTIMAVL